MSKLRHLAFLAALSMGVAAAAGTPVGTNITNQASASYTDPDGGAQTTNSNTVTTVTAPLPGVTLAPSEDDPTNVDASRSFTKNPGEQVVVSYTLTNTGNFTNSYALTTFVDKPNSGNSILENVVVKYYIDANSNGVYDAGTDPEVTAAISLAADAAAKLLMVYTVPSNATVGESLVIEPVATATVSSVTAGTPSQTFTAIPLVSDGKRTDGATAQTDPSVKADITPTGAVETSSTNIPDNFHKVTVVEGATLAATKTVAAYSTDGGTTFITGAPTTPLKIGDRLRYSVVAVNNGTQAVNSITVTDTLQTGTSFVSGAFTPAGGTGTTVTASGQTVTGTYVGNIAGSGGTLTLELVVSITSLADGADEGTANDPVDNSATVSGKDALSNNTVSSTDAIPTPIEVAALALGPNTKPLGNAAVGTGDDYSQTQPLPNEASTAPAYTVVADEDVQTIATVRLDTGTGTAGNTVVVFRNTVQNTGTSPDTYTLTSSLSGQPFGTTVTFYKDVDGSGTFNTGDTEIIGATDSVNAGATLTYLTVFTFPAGTAPQTADVTATITAKSVDNTAVSNSTTNVIGELVGGLLAGHNDTNITNDADNVIDNTGALSIATLAGNQVRFPIDLVNNNGSPVTLNPSGTVDFDGAGGNNPVAVVYYSDINENGVLDPEDLAAGAVTSLTIQPGTEVSLIAVVTPPAGTAGGTYNVVQTFDDPNTAGVEIGSPGTNGVVAFPQDTVVVANYTFTQSESGTITQPGSVVYSHTLTNQAGSGQNITAITLTDNESTDTGEQEKLDNVYFYDANSNGIVDTGEQITLGTAYTLPSGGIAPGGSTSLIKVRVATESGGVVPVGTVDSATITLVPTFATSGAAPSSSVTDTTTVQVSNTNGTVELDGVPGLTPGDNPLNYALAPIKSANKTQAKPGEDIVYTITATNNRKAPATLTNSSIFDSIPTNSEFVSVSGTCTTGTPVYKFNGGSWQTSALPSPILNSAVTSVAVGCDTNASGSITADDTLASGATITMTLTVKVK